MERSRAFWRGFGAAWTLLALASATPAAGAAETPAVRGVLDLPGGQPAAGVEVVLLPVGSDHARRIAELAGEDPSPAARALTGADGAFALPAPAPGVWAVEVRAVGHVPLRFGPFALAEDRTLPVAVLEPDAGASLTVLDGGRSPVPGAWVRAETARAPEREGWHAPVRLGRTDEAGRIALSRSAPDELTVLARHPDTVELAAGRISSGATLRFAGHPPVPRRLVVREEDGRPAGDVAVTVGTSGLPLGVTGPDGVLELPRSTPGPVVLDLWTADGRRHREIVRPWRGEEPGAVQEVRVTLPPSAVAAGRVVSAAGRRPLPGAVVRRVEDPGRYAVTDAAGRFRLPAGGPDKPVVVAAAGGHLETSVTWTEGSTPTTLVLPPAASLAGKALDPEGRPVAGVRVAASPNAGRPAEAHGASGADGAFALPGLRPDARYRIVARHPDRMPVRQMVATGPPAGPSREVVLTLAPRLPASGRVVDERERPVAGAEVVVRPASESGADTGTGAGLGAIRDADGPDAVIARTGTDGRFRLAGLPAPVVDLAVRKAGHAPALRRRVAPAVPAGAGASPSPADLGTIVLRPAVALRGRVLAADGGPIAGARIHRFHELSGSPRSLWLRALREEPAATTGPDGRFSLADLPADGEVHLVADAPGYLPDHRVGLRLDGPPTAAVTTFRLRPAARLAGRVLDEAGVAVAGARLDLSPNRVFSTIAPSAQLDTTLTVVSDARGGFEFPEVSAGRFVLSAQAEGFLPASPRPVVVRRGEAPDPLELHLERGATLEGVVTDEAGAPVAGARVSAEGPETTTDGDGRYRLTGLPPGEPRVEAFHPDYERAARRVSIERGTAAADFSLVAGRPVAGQVVDAEGRPVPDARVELFRGGSDPRRYRAASGAGGHFRFERVAAGTYDVAAEGAGFARARFEDLLTVGERPVADLEVRLAAGARIAGRVLGLDADALARVRVTAESGEGAEAIGVVDHRGAFEVRDLAPGSYRLVATLAGGSRSAEAWVTVRPGDGTVRRDLELGAGFRLGGVVTADGAPVAGARVSLSGASVAADRSVLADPRGEFRLEDLPPGSYRLGVTSPRDALTHDQAVELASDLELAIDLSTVVFGGVVADGESDAPLAGAAVSLLRLLGEGPGSGASRLTVTTGRPGTFRFARVAPGRYQLRAERAGYRPLERVVELAPADDRPGEVLLLEPAEGLEVTVRLASGAAPPHAVVSVVDAAGRPRQSEARMLDGSGRARFSSLPAAARRLRVEAPGGAVTVVPGPAAGRPVEVVLPPAGPLRVEVAALEDSPVLARLTVSGPGGAAFDVVETSGIVRRSWRVVAGRTVVEDLPAGTWHLRAEAADGRAWEGTVTTGPGGGAARLE